MERNEMVDHMINMIESTPEEASMYHRMDMLLGRMERLGMLPPDAMPPALSLTKRATEDAVWVNTRFRWEPEND